MWDVLVTYREGLLHGLIVTLQLAGIAWAIGLTVGTLLGWAAHRRAESVGRGLRVASFLAASIPTIVLLFWAHYPLQVLLGVVIHPFLTAAAILAFVNIIGVGSIVSTALEQFPQEFHTAARVCGLDHWTTVRRVTLPILVRAIAPALLTSQVVVLQSTLFASMISVEEVLRVSQRINATAYKPVEIFTAVAMLFLLVCLPLNGLAAILRRRFARNLSER